MAGRNSSGMGEEPKQNIIHNSFKHGSNFQIGNFCIIEEGVQVGDNVRIANYVLLKKGTRIGNNVFIDSYVRSSGNNFIGSDSTIRYGATIAKNVGIRRGVFISPNVMTIYSTHRHKTKKETIIGSEAFIGTAAIIGPGIEIGKNVVIGANTYVTKNCLDGKIYFGNPAKKIK